MRSKVSAIIDNSLEEDQVHLSISIDDGVTLEHSIDHATGSPQNPMPDSVLERKFIDLAGEVMPAHNVSELLHVLWELDKAPNLNKISQLISIK